jgi:hypothetical protein
VSYNSLEQLEGKQEKMNYMIQTRSRRFVLYGLTILAGVLVSCIVLALIGYNSNQKLPVGPEITNRMTTIDKVRLSEALHLKTELGDAIWDGFADLDSPVIIWNDDFEFLFNVNMPPANWEEVPEDDFEGKPYFRRPADNPQNFAVQVGEQWAGSIFTKYQLDKSLIKAVSDLLPPLISDIFPYKIFLQPSELQIAGVQHEVFHVFQTLHDPEKFAEAQATYQFDESYWLLDGDMHSVWKEEIELLIKAAESSSDGDVVEIVRQFLAHRDQRRQDFGLSADLLAYEVSMEWLEGTAKYVELRSWEEAGRDPNYVPLVEMTADPDFDDYEEFKSQWNQAVRQTRRQAGVEGDVRFYYTGMLQSYLLDRLMPDWKERILEDGVFLDDLLREALGQ